VDYYSGPNQDQPGSDGIGDESYNITAGNQDRYPLMKPYGGSFDIGITDITTFKTVIGQGYNLNVSVKITNYGLYTENFNITAYANTTMIATFTNVIIASRYSTTITFTWNTTGFAKGNYTIWAYAKPVPGETDTEDNTLTDGSVIVAMVGDVNGDGYINIKDIVLVSAIFGTKKGDPQYQPNSDVNGDGYINIKDIVLVSANFGAADP
jgi:hypothetical protein